LAIGHLRRYELLVDREFADPREHSGEGLEHATDVIGGVHVSRIEAGDHGVEPRLLFRAQRQVRRRDVRVGKRVVVERRVGVQVVGRREVAGVLIRPLLLQGNAEHRGTTDRRPHHRDEGNS
jgi:hypothetical protein